MAGKASPKQKRKVIRNLPMVIAQPDVGGEFKDRFGRPTKFKPEYIEIAREMAEDGATDKEMAAYFKVTVSTFYLWRNTIPAFAAVLKIGKDIANDRLERTAFDVAVGYTTTVKVHVKVREANGAERMVEIEQEVRVAPNERMLQWMLKNRKPETWRDKTEVEHTGEIVHLTVDQCRARLKAKIEEIKQARLAASDQPAG